MKGSILSNNIDEIASKTSNVDAKKLELVRDVIYQPEFATIHDANYHVYRYALSLQFLENNFENTELRVLELGEPGPFTQMLHKCFSNWNVLHQEEDLRSGIVFDSSSFDLVISTEVLEHIADTVIGHEITSEGVRDNLSEIHRVLKTNGKLFLTTPNASSIWNIKRILMQEPPLIYEKHYREFSHEELRELMIHAGFEIIKHESIIVWNFWDFSDIETFMKERKYDLRNRGDDQFALAMKK